MYKSVSDSMNFSEREKEVLKFWKENDIFNKSIEERKEGKTFTFFDGPPTANGKPHIGHVLTRAIKDLIPRYKTMKNYSVLRKAGWDTHGLPVELEVEKMLGINGKPEIEKFGIDKFNEECKKSVWKYKTEWEQMSDKIGYWADMKNPYITYNDNYIESVWWAIKTIWEKGLLYKGHKIVPYCPRCGTSLSSHEVSQGYKEVKEKSVYVKFPVKGRDNVYLLAWTTTPWTLPSNAALTVNPNINYIEAEVDGEILILSEELAPKVIEEYKTVKTMKGSELFGLEYNRIFDFADTNKKAWYVVTDDFVTTTDGTGIVHTAPAFGEDDAKVGRKYDLPFIQAVDSKGCFPEYVKPWAKMFVKDADPLIIKHLKQRGLVYSVKEHSHTYPFCWRCDTPLLYYALDTWFIEVTKVKEQLIKNNNSINWIPENIKNGRMGNFLNNVVDWGLSRSRYWGTPLPVWECECGHFHVVGSKEELRELGKDVGENIELHRPYVDKISIECPKCHKPMKRVTDVIDCWFDSGSMPFAQWHYPFENKDIFQKNFPADFISEAIDQTRGWFYTLLVISTLLFDKAPFKNCIVLGHVNDKNGIKMSKHKGNVISPDVVLNKQGADAVRWYFYINSAPWLPNRFYEEAVNETQRKFMGTLWNVYSFYVLYANIDKFNPLDYDIKKLKLSLMDKWILSRLNTLIAEVDDNLNNYKIVESARGIQNFVDELSNWYVRRGRERYWKNSVTDDKVSAYVTLYTVLTTLSKLIAPFVPFISEQIYQNLVLSLDKSAPRSVHLCDYPVCDKSFIDNEIEKNMESVLDIVSLGRACRNSASIKNRQPLSKMYVYSEQKNNLPQEYIELIKDELNIKAVEYADNIDKFVNYKFKPQLKVVGPRYGKYLSKISEFLKNIKDGNAVMEKLKKDKFISVNVGEEEIKLDEECLIIVQEQAEGFSFDKDTNYCVVIDTSLDKQLIREGIVREFVNKVQNMRKDSGLEVMDHINVYYSGSDVVFDAIDKASDGVKTELLANELTYSNDAPQNVLMSKDWDINGNKVNISIQKD